MNEKLIINARDKIGLGRRLLSDVSTALMWLGWIWLWLPFARKLHEMLRLGIGFGPAAIEVLKTVSPVSWDHALLALTGTSGLLLLWSLLPTRKAQGAHEAQTLDDYAEHFGLEPEDIETGRDARVCVIHHDDHGHIIGIEPRQPD